MIRHVIIVCADVPAARARVWGGAEENARFQSGVADSIPGIPMRDGWGDGAVSANLPTAFRAWACELARLNPVTRAAIRLRHSQGWIKVFVDVICEDEDVDELLELGDRRPSWKLRHVPAWLD